MSFRIQEISLAFKRSNCNEAKPLKTPAGRSLILFPYKTLREKKIIKIKKSGKKNNKKTHREVNDFNPLKAS